MNQRAFNLFTALVSFVLIMLAVLMVNMMTRTEERAIATISDLQQQSEMQTIADLARGDAFQSVVFNIRRYMELYFVNDATDYANGNENYIPLRKGDAWEDIIRNFTCARLGVNCTTAEDDGKVQLAQFVSTQIQGILYEGPQYGRYGVALRGLDAAGGADDFKNAVVDALDAGGEEVFELVDCSYDDTAHSADCDGGTFYINLRFDLISNERYEALPRIEVTDFNVTGAVLKTGIIPRSRLRVFVPLRVFQALARAKEIADRSIFVSEVENKLNSMKIGLCDAGACSRLSANLLAGATVDVQEFACAGTDMRTPGVDGNPVSAGFLPRPQSMGVGSLSFNPNSIPDMREKLELFAEQDLCASASAVLPPGSDATQLELVRGADNCVFANTNFSPSVKTRTIKFENGVFAGNGACVSFASQNNPAHLTLQFRENNVDYKVTDDLEGTYAIRIYPTFTGTPDPNYSDCTSVCIPPGTGIGCGSYECRA